MESGDGFLLRVRGSRGARGLSADDVRELARLARTHGNGLVEVTRRGRLQLRGVQASAIVGLQRALVQLGLAEESAELERRMSLVVNPLSGLRRDCADLEVVARALEFALAATPECSALSDKFGIVLDSGGWLREIAGDIHVDVLADQPDFADLSLAGAIDAVRADTDHTRANIEPRLANREPPAYWVALGRCRTFEVPRVILTLCRWLAEAGSPRIAEFVGSVGQESLRTRVCALDVDVSVAARDAPRASQSTELERTPPPNNAPARAAAAAHAAQLLGPHADATSWFGAAVPFGSADSRTWEVIAALADRFGSGEIRVTPFRSVLVLGTSERDREPFLRAVRDAGLICDPTDPLLRAIACPGAPACPSAHGETRALARALLPLMAANQTLHVSGCTKSCAHSGAADVTLLLAPDHACQVGFGERAADIGRSGATSLAVVRSQLSQLALSRQPVEQPSPARNARLPVVSAARGPAGSTTSPAQTRPLVLAPEPGSFQARAPATPR
jgi:precorrin-3B synthase